jgi:3-methyl-2-oxobutanoate hydroxymethyltransferase
MVAAARPLALIVGDLPFGSYQSSVTDAVTNAVRLIKAGAEIVKLEGGVHVADQIRAIAQADIPVMGHIGLTPQSYHRMGGNKIQGRTSGDSAGTRERLMEDAVAVEQAGACAVVIEGVPAELAAEITAKVSIPTIGIGAGIACNGQVLVLHDILGLSSRTFTFAKKYTDLLAAANTALAAYVSEVREGAWPDDEHSFQ